MNDGGTAATTILLFVDDDIVAPEDAPEKLVATAEADPGRPSSERLYY